MTLNIGREVVLEALSNHYKELNMPRYRSKDDIQEQPPQFQRFVARGKTDDEIIVKDGLDNTLTILIVTSGQSSEIEGGKLLDGGLEEMVMLAIQVKEDDDDAIILEDMTPREADNIITALKRNGIKYAIGRKTQKEPPKSGGGDVRAEDLPCPDCGGKVNKTPLGYTCAECETNFCEFELMEGR